MVPCNKYCTSLHHSRVGFTEHGDRMTFYRHLVAFVGESNLSSQDISLAKDYFELRTSKARKTQEENSTFLLTA